MIGLDGKPIEVQVRTHEMHRRAEYGIAAHWGYKENAATPQETLAAEIEWMQRIVDFQNETTDPIEFLEALKLDLEEDEVYVFTPRARSSPCRQRHAGRLRLHASTPRWATSASGPRSTAGWSRSTPG